MDKCYEQLRTIPQKYHQIPLTLILMLWDEMNPQSRISDYDEIRSGIESSGIMGSELRTEYIIELKKILENDPHLSICCGDQILNLATAIDLFYLSDLIRISMGSQHGAAAVFLYPIFENRIYLSEYKRTAFYHLFNFEVEESNKITFDSWTIQNIPQPYISRLLGESTPFSRLHSPDIGNYFLFYQDSESPKDTVDWLNSKYREALEIKGLFQYFRDEIVDIDYYTVFFLPEWVNPIWRMGTYFFGNIRRSSVATKYKLTKEEVPAAHTLWKVYKKNHDKLSKLSSSKLGQTIVRASRHFSSYHSKNIKEEQFIELIIALESLFSPGVTQELTYRISQYAGIFLGKEEKGFSTYEFIKGMLKKRGSLFHGQYDVAKVEKDQFLSEEEIKRFASYIRCAILGFIILYLRGEWNLEQIQQKLEKALFNIEIRHEITKKADRDQFIEESIKN